MVLNLSHIDLDGYSCGIVLKKWYPDIITYNCNYNKIEEYLEILHDKLSSNKRVNLIYITDLSFSESQFVMLLDLTEEFNKVQFVLIDHHPEQFDYSKYNQYFDINSNLNIIINLTKSATLLTFEYLYSNVSLNTKSNIDETYIQSVNAFDIWDTSSKYFKYGLMLNTLFWDYKYKRFLYVFKNMNKPLQEQIQDYKDIVAKKDKHFVRLTQKGLLIESHNVLISFTDKHLNWIQLDYPNNDFYINATSYGTINVRIGSNIPEEDAGNLKESLQLSLIKENWFTDMGGHKRAFGISHTGNNNSDVIVDCVKHIHNEIMKLKGNE